MIISNNKHINDETLGAIEQSLSFIFPKTYRAFLIEHNGGETDKKIFLFKKEPANGSVLDRLFGVIPNNYLNLLLYIRNYKKRIPDNCIPIGADPGSNLILLSVKGSDRGKIYFWDHEMEADTDQGEIPDYSNLTLIADSFDEFINNLKREDEIDI